GQGAVDLRWNALPGLGFGLLWQHLFDSVLSRDRLRLGIGMDLGAWTGLKGLRLGLGLDRLEQQYTLDPAYTYYGLPSTHAQAYDAAAGLLWSPTPWFSVGASGDQLTSPNLGLVGPDIFQPVFTWDGGLHLPLRSYGKPYLHFGQAWEDTGEGPTPQGGAEWSDPGGHLALRAGSDGTSLSVGAGFKIGGWRLDYAYRFGLGAEAEAFGGGQDMDLGLDFGGPPPRPSLGPKVTLTPTFVPMPPPPGPSPTATPDPALADLTRAISLWNQGQRRRALDTVRIAAREGGHPPAAAALESAWNAFLAVPSPAPTPAPEVRVGLAEARDLHLQGRDDLARATLKRLLKRTPDQRDLRAALRALGRPLADRTAHLKSRELFEKGLRLYAGGRTDEACAVWEKALKLDPENTEALNSLIRAQTQEGTAP
ncbi:MAG: tetratricopeptide repeat protein, partial [bacterium]